MFTNIAYMGKRRLEDLDSTSIHSNGVTFKFKDGGIGKVYIADNDDWCITYANSSVAFSYSNCDDMRPRNVISVLKQMIAISQIA